MLTITTPMSSSTLLTSSQLPPSDNNETMPVSVPDDTTVTPLVSEVPTTISSVDSDKTHMNATTMSSLLSSSTHMSLEGMDHKQSNAQ